MIRHIALSIVVLALMSAVVVKSVEVVYGAYETPQRMPEALRGIDVDSLKYN